ncbi:unnamed protein product [Adineta steineri]|uniref:RING-type domain-containing protein n=1 Tax=Adineta steineri TaxID=433720 RepID=A0A818IBA3_9BILA|nr:unnamed protein product [Adineta steineri]
MPSVLSTRKDIDKKEYLLYETKPFQQARERTFLVWKLGLYPCRMKMKEAGWFIVRTEDNAFVSVCLYCKIACKGWNCHHDPYEVHKFLSPKCVYVLYGHTIQTPSSSSIVESMSRHEQTRPSKHKMAILPERIKSFERWPLKTLHPSFDALAQGGFFYNNKNTTVQCFSCHCQISITNIDDNHMLAHTNSCKYAKHLQNHSSRNPLNLQSSNKTYDFNMNQMNDTTFYYLQCTSNTTIPAILLATKILFSNELEKNLKQLHPIDHQHRKINRMTSSDGPLVNNLKTLARNPIDLTNTSNNLQHLIDESTTLHMQTTFNSTFQCKTCLTNEASPHSVPIGCGHIGLCLNECFSKWNTCVICGYTLDPRVTNITFDNFTGSIYIINSESNDENHPKKSMLTSPRTNGANHFVPSHHLALITQPVLGARSRLRKKTTNMIDETSTTNKEKSDSMTNSYRGSYNDSPSLILPANRVDTSQYQKPKSNTNSHRESSDSGLDLSSSTNSSVQLQQYSQQHVLVHRPLSALNEDSSPDDGYHDEHQQTSNNNPVRLRFPPVNFGRNRSMEDILTPNRREQQQLQYRSGSSTDERQQKLSLQQDQKMKRSSDGALLDILDIPIESYRRSNTIKNELSYPLTNQHRSLNDLTNKNSNRAIRNESNMSISINNLPTTHTIIRKPNTSTLKPLRKKTKLNIIIEPSAPLTSSRLGIYDEQINAIARGTSSSSNQTTPRSTQPPSQQQQQSKSKATSSLGIYSNQEQMKTHVNRSVVERQHPTIPSHRGVIQQLIPFDASPSKINNLLLRHQVQQQQPTTNSTQQLSPSRQAKQTSRALYNEETLSNIEEEKRKQKVQIKIENFKEQAEKQRLKQKEELENHQKVQRRIKDIEEKISTNQNEQIITQKYFTKKKTFKNENIGEQQQTENTSRHRYELSNNTGGYYNNRNRNIIKERQGSGQSNTTTTKSQDSKTINRRPQRHPGYVLDTHHKNQQIHESKSTEVITRNKKFIRTSEINNQYGSDNIPKYTSIDVQSRPAKIHFQSFEPLPIRNPILLTQIESNQWHNSKHKSKPNRIEPINTYTFHREREISRLSDMSKTESIQSKQQIHEKNSVNNFQSRSPTSWSVISEHQNEQQKLQNFNKLNIYESESESSSQDELIENNSRTPSRTYRLMTNDQEQSHNEKHIIPSNNSQVSSLIEHTYPFTFTPDSEVNDNNIFDNNLSQSKQKSNVVDIYTLPERDISSSSSVHHSPIKKYYSPPPPPPPKVTISKDKDEILSNYESDDGWSDDSAELLYVDERYAKEKKKLTSSSHLPSQQHYHYQVQQQNVLL